MAAQKGKQGIILVILFNMVLMGICFGQTDRETIQKNRARALELVDKYTQALDSTVSFIEHYERTGEYRGRFPADHPHYSHHGSKEFRYKPFERGVFKFKENKGDYHHEYAWGYFNTDNKNIPEDKPIYRVWIRTEDFSYFNQINKGRQQSGSATLGKNSRQKIKTPITCYTGPSDLLGYIASDKRVDVILRKARRISVREKTETIRDSECFVIDAHTMYGQYSVWVDPEHGYHAAKIRRSAKEGEYFNRPDRKVPAGSVSTEYLDVLDFKKVDGLWVPVEAKAGSHRTIGSPAYYMDEDKHYKRTKIILNPDHDRLGSFADPIFEDPNNDPELVNGTTVEIGINEKELRYTWKDSKLIDENGTEVDMDDLKELLEAQEKEG